jgi:hypothetical protein
MIENDEIEKQARAFFEQGNFLAAEKLFRALALGAPSDAVAHYNLGVCVAKLERFEDALACYRRAIELNPGFADAYTNFGVCLNALNLVPQARQAFALARKLVPTNPIPQLNEGIAALALGDYEPGWRDFSARWELPAYGKFKREFDQPMWSGEDLNSKTLFLYHEQGFGDTLQMARYASLLAKRGVKIIIEAPPALRGLLRSLDGIFAVVSRDDETPAFDFYCAMMDIPLVMKTVLETIPSHTPYLFADPLRINFYRNLLPAGQAKKIGLSWAGRSSHENDRNRSLLFSQLAPLISLSEINWVSLQRRIPEEDKGEFSASPVIDWGQEFSDFAATAAAIMTLDLVITVDTAIAHLAGALGKKVWVLLPFYADWRWLIARDDSPWYPTARLIRQERPKDWQRVIERLREEISAMDGPF